MARRGEGQFVAVEVNLRGDPKLLGMARALRITRLEAMAYVAIWREFVLTKGSGHGVVKGYTKTEIASFLDWTGPPARILKALREAGYLGLRRGGTYFYPHWAETVTGYYALRRAADRDRKAKGNGHGDSTEVPRNGVGTSTPVPADSAHQSSKGPPSPPQGGVGGASPGTEDLETWFLAEYPKVRNPTACKKLLAALGPAEAAQLRYAVPLHARLYIPLLHTGRRHFVPDAVKYLEEQYFFEFKPPEITKARKAAAAADAPRLTPEEEEAELRARAVTYVLEQLADQEVTDERKAVIKKQWLARWGEPAPWVTS